MEDLREEIQTWEKKKREPEDFDDAIEPLGRNIYVKWDKKHEKFGELWMPQKTQQRTRVGVVLKVGPEARELFKVGDKVVMPDYIGNRIYLPGYRVIDDDRILLACIEVMAKLNEPDEEE